MDDKHPITHLLMVVTAWTATVTLANIQILVAILSGLLVGFYTCLKIYYLVKDRKVKDE